MSTKKLSRAPGSGVVSTGRGRIVPYDWVPIGVKRAVEWELLKCISLYEGKTGNQVPFPRVTFSLRGSCAGVSYSGNNWLDFNPVLMEKDLFQFLYWIVAHELAHIITDKFNPERFHHGPNWVRTMAFLEKPAIKRFTIKGSGVVPGGVRYRKTKWLE